MNKCYIFLEGPSNVTVEWLSLLRQEIPIQILSRKPAILTDGFSGFSQFLQENAGIPSYISPRSCRFY